MKEESARRLAVAIVSLVTTMQDYRKPEFDETAFKRDLDYLILSLQEEVVEKEQ